MTPAKRPSTRALTVSTLRAALRTEAPPKGGSINASFDHVTEKRASFRRARSWAREKGWPWPKGERSEDDHNPRRFGTTR